LIIIDFSGTIHSSIHAFSADLKRDPDNMDGIIRHVILTSVLNVRKKFPAHKYGNIVIAIDDRNYWRRDIFPHYKANRKKAREESGIDWNKVFTITDQLIDDLSEHFTYKVIKVNRAEADDVVAVLTKYTQTNELQKIGFDTEMQPVVVVSEDQDFVQLMKYGNFQLWLPRKKKFHAQLNTGELKEYVNEHVCKAGDDGIPTINCDDDHFVKEEKVRAKPITAKMKAEFREKGRDACDSDIQRRNWDRNARLIKFEYIPEDVEQSIVDAYVNYNLTGSKSKIFNYLVKNRCRQLLDNVEEF